MPKATTSSKLQSVGWSSNRPPTRATASSADTPATAATLQPAGVADPASAAMTDFARRTVSLSSGVSAAPAGGGPNSSGVGPASASRPGDHPDIMSRHGSPPAATSSAAWSGRPSYTAFHSAVRPSSTGSPMVLIVRTVGEPHSSSVRTSPAGSRRGDALVGRRQGHPDVLGPSQATLAHASSPLVDHR